jgi:DNA-binding transcriptional regulator YhcF (GntR family)
MGTARESQTARGISLPRLGMLHVPLREAVTDALRKAILSKRLKPGERLVEEQLAAELEVSRNPVREALRVLESEGLVEISPRRGASVTQLSEEEARELVEVRAALEGLCARLAARRCTPSMKAEILALLNNGEQPGRNMPASCARLPTATRNWRRSWPAVMSCASAKMMAENSSGAPFYRGER